MITPLLKTNLDSIIKDLSAFGKHALWLLATLIFVLQIADNQPAHADERPNFVWLISEDNSKHYLKLFDQHGADTPNIRRLAESGLVFENAYSNSPVCSVARTTLLTGCYAPRIGAQYHRRAKLVPMPKGLNPFPQYLREAGYYTTNRRKTDYNVVAGKKIWNESSNRASWRNRKPGQPFFHKQSFSVSHEGSLHFPRRVFENEKTNTDPKSVFVHPYHPDTKVFRYTNARYRDRIMMMDEQVGKVIKQLEDDGLLDTTFIFYFGDHGGVLPRSKGYAYETGVHVPLVVHIPTKFRHLVDQKPGSKVGGFVSFIDFGPTLLNLAGIGVNKEFDGRPFLGEGVKSDDVEKRNEVFCYADRFDEKYDLVRTIRKGKFKYIRNYQPFNFDGLQNNYRYKMLAYQEWRQLYRQGKLNKAQSHFFEPRPAEELYDLENDPYEINNLAKKEAYRETLELLRDRLTQHVKSTRDLSFFPENYLVENAFQNPTGFGKTNEKRIAELVDIANLSLESSGQKRSRLSQAINSNDPIKRYWGWISCTAGRVESSDFLLKQIQEIKQGENVLVRVRAAEYGAIVHKKDATKAIVDCLKESKDGVEASLILNTLVLLRDGSTGLKFEVKKSDLNSDVLKNDNVKRRLQYLTEIK